MSTIEYGSSLLVSLTDAIHISMGRVKASDEVHVMVSTTRHPESRVLTLERARALYVALKVMFGDKVEDKSNG